MGTGPSGEAPETRGRGQRLGPACKHLGSKIKRVWSLNAGCGCGPCCDLPRQGLPSYLRPDNPAEAVSYSTVPYSAPKDSAACELFLFSTIHAQEKIEQCYFFHSLHH